MECMADQHSKQVPQDLSRTIKLRVMMPLALAQQTIQQYLDACNHISQCAFEQDGMTNARRLQERVYYDVRAMFKLSAQATCSAIREVAGKYQSARSNNQSLHAPIHFKNFSRQYQLERDFAYTQAGQLSLSTAEGRQKFAIHAGQWAAKYADWTLGGGVLFIQRGKVYFAQTISKPKPTTAVSGTVLGLDRGINLIATATDGHTAAFFAGGRVKQRRRYYRNLRASLQQKKAHRNTRSTARLLQRLAGREARFQTDVNHVVSKQIVRMAVKGGCHTIATEALKGIRERANDLSKPMREMVNAWAFYELQAYIEYKAEEVGIRLIEIDPAYTSQRCSRCGYVDKANRHKHIFCCRNCHYQLHADLNAAHNIRARGIAVG